ncbi:MAG: hypothetical protein A3G20_06380 [Acidobacteria bacterium RIFCSPLOWO2_12_FULL_59_11]|nr:MAG: hypothetical protein A3H95_14075 [Acidobacteria bacterium RIFCSPLOWO2_02_FULL_64_15]OFW01770.1 MAG: hypothetical protein A3G20_06380 [Acidobacteria bacterium RIFCSPLOWO2_12_FULL_59_11]
MAKRVPARLTRKEGRRFGLTVGGAFLVLAGITLWRGHPTSANVLGALGGTLVVAGLLIPTHLGPVNQAWMALAHEISRVTTPIVMAVMYFLVLTPFGLVRRMVGHNSLVHARTATGFWTDRRAESRRRTSMERQF